MTLFAKSGLRPALLFAAFLSFSVSNTLMENPVYAQAGHGLEQAAAKTNNGYRPRVRIENHPRNRNRHAATYQRGDRTIRVIDTSRSTSIAPKTAFNAQRNTGGFSFDNTSERLILRLLRREIGAIEAETARARAADRLARRVGNGVSIDSAITGVGGGEFFRPSPSESFLREGGSANVQRPKAGIIHVTESQKIIGEQRAAARARRFNQEDASRYFRYYRPNEAYDVRFPSVVYLKSD